MRFIISFAKFSIVFLFFFQVITNPLTKKIVEVNKGVIRAIASNDSSAENLSILKVIVVVVIIQRIHFSSIRTSSYKALVEIEKKLVLLNITAVSG